MRRLILTRHAKSSWDAPLDDHSRPLNDRGRQACAALGGWMKQQGYLPDEVISSDAQRTRETTERIMLGAQAEPKVTFLSTLYLAEPAMLLHALRSATGATVALIGHNPGIAFFASSIVATTPSHHRFDDYPTGATLVCDLGIEHWSEAEFGTANMIDFVVPRDITEPS